MQSVDKEQTAHCSVVNERLMDFPALGACLFNKLENPREAFTVKSQE
jgi:hypothetical protein